MDGGQKGISIVPRPPLGRHWANRGVSRQVLVLGAQAVGNPTSHGGTDQVGRPGVKEEGRRTVSHPLGVHGMNESQIIHLTGNVRKKGGYVLATLAMLLEVPHRLHQLPFALLAEGSGAHPDEIDVLLILGKELGFVVEGVGVAGTTGHENEDDPLGSLRDEGVLGRKGIPRDAMGALHSGNSKCPDATSG